MYTYTRLACLLSHGRNAVGDKLRVTTLLNSQKLFTKLLVGSGGPYYTDDNSQSRTSILEPPFILLVFSQERYLVIPVCVVLSRKKKKSLQRT